MERNFFYNDFVSSILFKNDQKLDEIVHCKETLARVAIVDIQMTSADAIVLLPHVQSRTSIWTNTGGLLSLYVGFSFLSLADTVYLVLKFILTHLSSSSTMISYLRLFSTLPG